MPTSTFTGTLKYWPGGNSGQIRQGWYNGTQYSGTATFNFAGTVDVSNINITQIVLEFTVGDLGGDYTKYLYLRTGSTTGTSVGNYSFKSCYSTTKSKTFSASSNTSGFNALKAYIEGGGTVLGVNKNGASRGKSDSKPYDYDYMNITALSLTITYTYLRSKGSVENTQTGSAATLTITPYNNSYKHKVTWQLGSDTTTETIAAGTTTATHTFAHSCLPNSTVGYATVTLETLDGSTSLGSNTYSFRVTVPSSVIPTITTWSVAPVQQTTGATNVGGSTYYIQNKTKPKVTLTTAAAGSGASIAKYSLTTSPNCGSLSRTSWTSGTGYTLNLLAVSGTVTFTLKITDSRGRTATGTKTITVQAYDAPQFSAVPTAYRCTSNGTRNDTDGTYAKLTATFTYSSVSGQNSLTVKRVTLNSVNTTLTSGTAAVIGAGALEQDKSYSAVITLTDAVGETSTYTLTIPSAAYMIHFKAGGKALGLGCSAGDAANNTVKVGWGIESDTYIRAKGNVIRKHPSADATKADNDVSETQYPGFYIGDSNNKTIGEFITGIFANGKTAAMMLVRNYSANGTSVGEKGIYVYMDKQGDATYLVSDAANFRNAIGFSSGILPVSLGGTGASTAQDARAALNLGSADNNFTVTHGNQSSATQAFVLNCTVDNSANTALNGHWLNLIVYNGNLSLYDNTASGYLWRMPATATANIAWRSWSANTSTDVEIEWNTALPSADYNLSGCRTATGNNGDTVAGWANLEWIVLSKTTTGATIRVYNGGAQTSCGFMFTATARI